MTDDAELLRQYVQAGSEDAFAELVHRHLPVVYSSALRQTGGDVELARDISQTVFIDLARKARSLLGHELLIAWLYTATRFTAATAVRGNRRRQIRERIAVSMYDDASEPVPRCGELQFASALDAAMTDLATEDRNAVLLRFFQGKDLREVGAALGITEDAARMRVTRAIGKLHSLLENRGVAVSTAALGSLIATEAVTAAPPGLAVTISTAALAGTTIATTATATATKTIAMTMLPKTLITATIALAIGTGLYEARQASVLRSQVQALQQKQAPSALGAEEWRRQGDEATKRLAAAEQENARLRSEAADVHRLRAEVTALRQAARERATTESTAGAWAARISLLKQRLDQMPDKRIPEMEFLTEKDWAAASREADPETDDGARQALSALRSAAKDNFLRAMRNAFRKYAAAANGGNLPDDPAQVAQAINANAALFPSDLAQLKPYFDVPVEDATFQRYQYLHPGKLHDNLSDTLVKEVAPPVDAEFDTHHEIGLNSGGTGQVNLIEDAVAAAAKSYAQANNGQMPSEPAQIAPYLKQPLEAALVQKYLSKLGGTNITSVGGP